ncbi:MAG: methionine--tRNA ligase [Victivallaceae bacterium]
MENGNFYITTPIYYVNDRPHIGHAYTTILADVLARYHRSLDIPTFFLTGTDEHGQKVQKAAEKNNLAPQAHCDETVIRFKELWRKLEITNDKFIRTTDPEHKAVVQKILQELYDRGLIYKNEYKGRYCVHCERFFTDKDLSGATLCPEDGCGRETSEIVESNYFFRMSQYQDWLIDHIKTHPEFIQPAFRANETLGFLRNPLGDLCISRPKSRLHWGIELPFDSDFVCYVWFDALINYISGVGYGTDEAMFKKWWPASYHLIGKDILTTHTVYWPTMLKAMGVELPKTIFAHGWWMIGAEKMSKSRGNVVNPIDLIQKYGVDAFRYFLMAEMSLGQDAVFSEDAFINRYNCDLANDLGNLLSRVVKMTLRNCGGVIPVPHVETDTETDLKEIIRRAIPEMEDAINGMKLEHGIAQIMNVVRAGNRYLEKTAPWTLAKNGSTDRLNSVLYYSAEILRNVSVLLYPVMPRKMVELRRVLGIPESELENCRISDLNNQQNVLSGLQMTDIDALFLRINTEEEKPAEQKPAAGRPAKTPETKAEVLPEGIITIDEFFKTQLRTAKVLKAERIEGADKLLKLQIELGGEVRQLVAGVAQYYTPEEITGRIIVVVANLKPAKIRGVESQGMLLAAKDGKDLKLITVDGPFVSGAPVG